MNSSLLPLRLVAAAGLCLILSSPAWADPPEESKPAQPAPQKPKYPPYADVLANAHGIEGLIKLHQKDMKLFAELSPGDLNKDLMVAIAIARGIAERPLFGGMTWGFGDDWIWQFRKADERIQIVRRNVRFRAAKGSPLEKAVHISYTDSILYSLPIVTMSPSGNFVVDLTPVFLSDLPQISSILQGFAFAQDRSCVSRVKGFKDNVELEIAATYASNGARSFDTVPDSRGVTLYLHYSISRLPETGYQPRLADDRVGHFITALKDFSKTGEEDQFVRYVNRWDLRKTEPSAKVSPPTEPIIFWIEKTVPYKFRGAVREGILEWNKAYEKAGFSDAIEIRQQPDDATWDPEDINYNTFRWITSNADFAMGPSRVNPLTGQILDADIIFDAGFIDRWTENHDTFIPEQAANSPDSALSIDSYIEKLRKIPNFLRHDRLNNRDYSRGMADQLAFGSMAISASGKKLSPEEVEKFLIDGVRSVATHEVGHTLGLRHNFKASAFLTMEEINDPAKTREVGLAASVMDYIPVNISPKGKKQGEYFSSTLGPYDYWAIEYAYKPLPGGTEGEVAELAKIASRCTEPALRYSTDEDCRGIDPDPLVNRFDQSKDPIEFARWRLESIHQIMPDMVEKSVEPGEGYQQVRRSFNILMREHGRVMGYVARFIGGVSINRDHKGDPNALPPFVVTEPKKQREALDLLEKEIFSPEAFQFQPKLYNYLAASHWEHWGMKEIMRPDFPVHETILMNQFQVLQRILSPMTLSRVIDAELKTPPDQDAFTAAELLQRLTAAIFRETEKLQEGKFTDRTPAISSLRRNLQQHYFQVLADLAMGNTPAPADCQSVAAAELEALASRLNQVLIGKAQLDTYTRSHLSELHKRITKVLEARLELKQP